MIVSIQQTFCRSDCRDPSIPDLGSGKMESQHLVARYLSRGAQITGVATMSLTLTWISVSLRFYVRVRILKFIGKEDWLTLAAMVGSKWKLIKTPPDRMLNKLV